MRRLALVLLITLVQAHWGPSKGQEDIDLGPNDAIEAEIGGERTEVEVDARSDLNITMDLDFDGNLDRDDDALEDGRSAIVIANIDKAYVSVDAFDEPARRKKLSVKDPTGKIMLKRSSPNVHVFKAESGGVDVFKPNVNDVPDLSVGDYWVQGGDAPSKALGDEFIEAVSGQTGAPPPSDRVKITVLWVELIEGTAGAGFGKGLAEVLPDPLFEHPRDLERQQGHIMLGLHRSTAKSEDGPMSARGTVQFVGEIKPPIREADRNAFGLPITSKLEKLAGAPATAEFGFIFRRFVRKVWVEDDGQNKSDSTVFVPDDSKPYFQDTNPNWDEKEKRSVIVDVDGPGAKQKREADACTTRNPENFWHLRDNFVTFVVFKSEFGQAPERVSVKRKYSFSADIGYDTDDHATFLYSAVGDHPNDGRGLNDFAFSHQLDLANLGNFGLEEPRITHVSLDKIDGVAVPNGNPPWQLPYSGKITLTVKGVGLAGEFSMVEQISKDQERQVPLDSVVRVYPLAGVEFSDVTKVELTFCTGLVDSRVSASRRLAPSVFPYILKFRSPVGETTYPAGKFVTIRQAAGPQRTIRIERIKPYPEEKPLSKQVITLRNTSDQPQSLAGWQLNTIDLHRFKRHVHEFGGDVVLAPGTTTDIILKDTTPDLLDYENRGALVFLVRRDRATIEDFVGYQKEDVKMGEFLYPR